MRRYYEQALARAERKLCHLVDYREGLRANHGAPYPATLDERIERARLDVKMLTELVAMEE